MLKERFFATEASVPAGAETLRYAQGDSLASFFPSEMRLALWTYSE